MFVENFKLLFFEIKKERRSKTSSSEGGKVILKRLVGWLFGVMFALNSVMGMESIPSQMLLRCADVHALDYPTIAGVRHFGDLVQKRTGGRIRIEIYPGSSLGSERSVVEMVQLGALDMGRVSSSEVAEVAPTLGALLLPYLFKDNEHKWRVLNGPTGRRLLEGLARVGLIGLSFQEAGYRSIYNSKHPIYRPADIAGLKLRVQPNQIMVEMMESLAVAPVPIDYGQVYSALEAKVIDGAENNIPSYYTSGHYKFAKYFSLTRHVSFPEIVILSQKTWSRLSPTDQEILLAAAQESVNYQRARWAEFEADCRKKLLAAGCRFNEVDPAPFQAAVEPFYQNYRRRHRTLLAEIEQLK